ncbi:MAG: hypothetical protein ABI142_08360 [Bryocella sp.]
MMTVLEAVGNDLKGFYEKLASDYKKARAAWLVISGAQTRAVLLKIGGDVINLVKDAVAAGAAKGLSLTLDEVIVADVRQLIADAKAGDGVIEADLKALGIAL